MAPETYRGYTFLHGAYGTASLGKTFIYNGEPVRHNLVGSTDGDCPKQFVDRLCNAQVSA